MATKKNGMLAPPADEPETAADQPDEAEQGAEPNVTEEEQAAKDRFVTKGFELVYDDKNFPSVMESVYGAGDPVTGLAATTATLVTRLADSAKKAGVELSPDVLLHGGSELLEDLASTAGKAKLHDYSQEEIDAATLRAMDMARDQLTKMGLLDPNTLKQEFGQIVQADREGRLGEMVPGLDQASARYGGAQGGDSDPTATPFTDRGDGKPTGPNRDGRGFGRGPNGMAPMRTAPPDRGQDANELDGQPWNDEDARDRLRSA